MEQDQGTGTTSEGRLVEMQGGGSERETADGKELRGPTDKESVKQRRG